MTLTFADLWNNYPTESHANLFTHLGGGWPRVDLESGVRKHVHDPSLGGA